MIPNIKKIKFQIKSSFLPILLTTTLISSNTFSQSLISKDSTKLAFDGFLSQLKQYEEVSKEANVPFFPMHPCDQYVLEWITSFDTQTQSTHTKIDEPQTLCADKERYEEINEETQESKSPYGTWHYSFRAIGDKYFIITGSPAIARSVRVTYYYVRNVN